MSEDIIIHPKKTKKDKELPSLGVFFVNPGEAKRVLEQTIQSGGARLFLHNSGLCITGDGVKFIAGPGLGAPAAALVMEKLIVLGAKKIVLMGWCGAIDQGYRVGDIIVPDGAVSGEGTSRYYMADTQTGPSANLTAQLRKLLGNSEFPVKKGKIWSTDAPYRESRSYLEALHKKDDVVGVDMEFSALCSVAAFRDIDFAAAMVVSDEVWHKDWKSGVKNRAFISARDYLIEKLLDLEL